MGKKKLRFNKHTVLIYILIHLLIYGHINKRKLREEMELNYLTMHRYYNELLCGLSNIGFTEIKINSTPEKYILSNK